MGLQFYLGEIHAQENEVARMTQEAHQAIAMLQDCIAHFLSAPLSSKAYDSAKKYFMTVYIPLCRSAILTGEALANAHKCLLSEYQAMVGNADTIEDQLLHQIEQLERLKYNLERQMHLLKTMQPYLEQRHRNACEALAKKREKLEKLHAYNAKSANIFAEYASCQQEFNNGLAQVKDCRAWHAASGTFDLKKLDMRWAQPIHSRWTKRTEMEKQKTSKESNPYHIKNMLEDFVEGISPSEFSKESLGSFLEKTSNKVLQEGKNIGKSWAAKLQPRSTLGTFVTDTFKPRKWATSKLRVMSDSTSKFIGNTAKWGGSGLIMLGAFLEAKDFYDEHQNVGRAVAYSAVVTTASSIIGYGVAAGAAIIGAPVTAGIIITVGVGATVSVGIKALYNNSKTFKNAINSVGDAINSVVNNLGNAYADSLKSLEGVFG